MITSGLNADDDTADCSGNLNSTKSTDGSAGTLTAGILSDFAIFQFPYFIYYLIKKIAVMANN